MIEESTRQTRKLRKVVYTCITAGYTTVPVRPQRGWDYVCFSEEPIDQYKQRLGRWPNVAVPRTLTDALLETRCIGTRRRTSWNCSRR